MKEAWVRDSAGKQQSRKEGDASVMGVGRRKDILGREQH